MTIARFLRRILKGVAVLAVLVVLGAGALLAFAWLEHRTEVTLPIPTGSFTVGRTIQDWTDEAHVDTLAPVPGTKRELLVWIWYPSAAGQPAMMDDYLPAQLRPKAAPEGGANIWTLLTRDVSNVRGHSARDPDVSPLQRSYPVVILRAGASSGVLNYSTLAEDLASHGYVVVGFDAPYRTGRVVFPDGRMMGRTEQNNPESCVVPDRSQMERCASRVMTAWQSDIAFVLDRLARLNASDSSGKLLGRLDLTRVGVFGHSFGGAVAAQFCHEDSRCKAGIDIDGAPHGSVIQAGLSQPFMFLLSDHGDASDPASSQILTDIKSIYDRIPPDRRLLATIRGAFHFTFSDDGALLKSRVVRGVLRLSGKLGIDGRRQLAVTAYCLHTFFDMYLKGAGGSRLSISSPLYPEIEALE
ncbi:MAG TPA: family membership [Thermoanaerobaculia bacterium]|nr:family membership [Thermoanaerobaculia bacterium]